MKRNSQPSALMAKYKTVINRKMQRLREKWSREKLLGKFAIKG
jgi:hypothetical protein